VCGCGTPDTDSDSDGTADCQDACPSDPAKTQPGLCGCGVADTDSDGDGTPDCEEPQAEVCGNCQDDDGDGLLDLLDPDCPASSFTLQKGVLTLGQPEPEDDKVTLRGTLTVTPTLLNPPVDGATLSFVDADGPIACFLFPSGAGWTTKAGPQWTFQTRELKLKFNARQGTFALTVKVKEAALHDPDAGSISTMLQLGTHGFLHQGEWRSTAKGKKLVTP
jgi:hypothetical protein